MIQKRECRRSVSTADIVSLKRLDDLEMPVKCL